MNESIIAVAFPGQGSQRPGMGNDFYENISISRNTYCEASDVLGWDVAAMCFGEDERLNLTEYAQPCILTTEIAMLRGLHSIYGFTPEYFCGHSLGEYTALVAAGVVPFSEALKIVSFRGQLMQEAMPVGTGGMAAIISNNLDLGVVRSTLKGLPIDVANDNSCNQVVISGESRAMPEAKERLTKVFGDKGSFRFISLNVSAPFHSRFMSTVVEAFKNALRALILKLIPKNAEKVTSNFTGYFYSDHSSEIIDYLAFQLSSTVQWKKNMEAIASVANSIYEIGPSRPLSGFFKTAGVPCMSVSTLSAANRLFEKH
jgi:[acyl-carrier-protein] S-malonyltransferase/trans-AT polyketide synthase/acyltransferase/oxidoreductase domain-containing protein